MASLTLRNIDEETKARLRMSAAAKGRSMEEEARQILTAALLRERCAQGIGSRIAERFARCGGVELQGIQRHKHRQPPDLT